MTGWEIKTRLHLQNQLIYALRLCSTHIHYTYTAGAELAEVTKMPLDGARNHPAVKLECLSPG